MPTPQEFQIIQFAFLSNDRSSSGLHRDGRGRTKSDPAKSVPLAHCRIDLSSEPGEWRSVEINQSGVNSPQMQLRLPPHLLFDRPYAGKLKRSGTSPRFQTRSFTSLFSLLPLLSLPMDRHCHPCICDLYPILDDTTAQQPIAVIPNGRLSGSDAKLWFIEHDPDPIAL
jgi:hypothetical protein